MKTQKYTFTKEEMEVTPYDVAEFLDSEEMIAGYLAESLTDPDPGQFLKALGNVARARGMAQLAKDTGLAREALYRIFQAGKKPQFDTIMRITKALGVPLAPTVEKREAAPVKHRRKREAVMA